MKTVYIHNRLFTVCAGQLLSAAEERELCLWMQALTVEEASAFESRSPETVRKHRQNIRAKTGQSSGIGVLTWCLSNGLIFPTDNNGTFARATEASRTFTEEDLRTFDRPAVLRRRPSYRLHW